MDRATLELAISQVREEIEEAVTGGQLGQLYARLKKLKQELAAGVACMMLAYMAWLTLDLDIAYFMAAPNTYRIFTRVLILFHSAPFSFTTLVCGSWGLSMAALCFLVPKQELGGVVIWAVLMSLSGSVGSGPMYPLLFLLGRTKQPALLVPLLMVKEHAFIIGVLFLLSQRRFSLYMLLGGGIYVCTFVLLGPTTYAIGAAPMFTPVYALAHAGEHIIPLVSLCAIMALSTCDRRLFVLNAGLVCALGLFWEAQLWFPLVVLAWATRKESPAEEATH